MDAPGFCQQYLDSVVSSGTWLKTPLSSLIASLFMCCSLIFLVLKMSMLYKKAYDHAELALFSKRRVVQVLPAYYWFAQLVCLWFTLTACSLFLPYKSHTSEIVGHILYIGHGFFDNFLIAWGYQKSADKRAIYRTTFITGLICAAKTILIVVYGGDDAIHCSWCSTFFPVPQAGYFDISLAVVYVAITVCLRSRRLIKFSPRQEIGEWVIFMAVAYSTVSIAAMLLSADVDGGYCLESAAVYIYAGFYALFLYRTFVRDSKFFQGFDERLLSNPASTSGGASTLLLGGGGGPRASSIDSALQRLKDLSVSVIKWRHLVIGDRIGSGGFGEVFRGTWRGTPVAVKRMFPLPAGMVSGTTETAGNAAADLLNAFGHETSIMQRLRHPNIVTLMGVSATRAGDLCIVTELMTRGSIFDIIHNGSGKLSPYVAAHVGTHTCRGMAYMHGFTPVVMHRDLKSSNLLVDDHWTVKCADFGLSREVYSVATTRVGSVQWAAPEILRGEEYTASCDVYSFGVCMWECLAGKIPHSGLTPVAVVTAVGLRGLELDLNEVPEAFRQTLRLCLKAVPAQRPPFTDLVAAFTAIKRAAVRTPMPDTARTSSV